MKQQPKMFSALIIIMMMLSFAAANAQIVYTDINPDITKSCSITAIPASCSSSYNLDLNNDGITDFVITSSRTNTTFLNTKIGTVKITPVGSNAVADSSTYPFAYKLNKNITANLQWSTAANQTLSFYNTHKTCASIGCPTTTTYLGKWNNVSDKYVGLKIIVGAHTYYGWAQLSMGGSAVTIQDYAYDSTPNHSIHAGVTSGVRLAEEDVSHPYQLKLFPNPATNSVTIISPDFEAGEISIINFFGQIVYSEKIDAEQTQIDVSRFPAAMYMLRWSNVENNETKRFSIIK